MKRLLVLAALVAVSGCTQKPAVPPLPSDPSQKALGAIVLGSELSHHDVRTLFRAVNQSGKLNAVRPWVEDLSDAELDTLAKGFSRWVLNESLSENGLVTALRHRDQHDAFRSALALAREVTAPGTPAAEWEVALSAVTHPVFATVLVAHRDLIRAENFHALTTAYESLLASDGSLVPETQAQLQRTLLSLQKLGEHPTIRQTERLRANPSLFQKWRRFGENFLAAADALVSKFPNRGGTRGLASNLRPAWQSGELAAAVQLLAFSTETPPGFFRDFQEGARRPGSGLELNTGILDRFLLSSLADSTLREIEKGTSGRKDFFKKLAASGADAHPSAEFRELFRLIVQGFEHELGITPSAEHPAFALRALPIYLNALALTRWFTEISRSTPDFRPSEGFSFPQETRFATERLRERREGRWVWTEAMAAERALFSRPFQETLDLLLPAENGFGGFSYLFAEIPPQTALCDALNEAIATAHERLPFTETNTALRVAISSVDFSQFEQSASTGLFLPLHQIVAGIPFKLAQSFEEFLLVDLDLQNADSLLAKQFLGWMTTQPQKDNLRALLSRAHTLLALNIPHAEGLPPAFESYHALIRNLNERDFLPLGELFVLTRDLALTDPAGDFAPLTETVLNGNRLPRWLELLARGHSAGASLADATVHAVSTAPEHFALLGAMLQTSGSSGNLETLLSDVLDLNWRSPLWQIFSLPTNEERAFLYRLLADTDGQAFVTFLHRKAKRNNVVALTTELLDLEASGELREALLLLRLVQDDRLRAVVDGLLKASHSGALANALNSLRLLAENPNHLDSPQR